MDQRWTKFKSASPGVWAIRAILLICVVGIVIIQMGKYFAAPMIGAVNVNLRSDPSPYGQVLKQLPHDTKYRVIKKNSNTNWWQIKADNKTGWVASWLIDRSQYNAKKATKLDEATIVLDPGHGGRDSGTLTHLGTSVKDMEKTYTLPLALQVRSLLKHYDTQVIMTRTTDKTVSLAQRSSISNKSAANLFISFHYNSSPSVNDGTGYGIYKYYETADAFANQLDTSFSNLPLYDRGINFGNFYVLRTNQRPAILIEMGFMDNTKDFKYIQNLQYRTTVANDILSAMQKFFN